MKKGFLVYILLIVLLSINVFSYQYQDYNPYRDYGYNSYNYQGYGYDYGYGEGFIEGLNFLEVYFKYSYFVDFLLFLLIFLGLTKGVFGEKFRDARGISVGVGVLMSIALVYAEYNRELQTGERFTVIGNLAPIVFLVGAMLVSLLVYGMFDKLGWGRWISAGFTIVILIAFVSVFVGWQNACLYLDTLAGRQGWCSSTGSTFFWVGAAIALVVGLGNFVFRRPNITIGGRGP